MNHNIESATTEIEFRIARKEELSEIIDLFSDSFKNDPLMNIFNPKGKKSKSIYT